MRELYIHIHLFIIFIPSTIDSGALTSGGFTIFDAEMKKKLFNFFDYFKLVKTIFNLYEDFLLLIKTLFVNF